VIQGTNALRVQWTG
jgi:hypothetical protein